eukprot:TRINITY_DN16746_c0_g1_i6.p1 TRINITY_DN16746_c0_g1~~TRINITY_DN16746_c0_g1_i6.p1  ORF type:complete len:683 (-),score=124.03 TRINITY_DN16746_c0_g1_i6:126-1880(-)
MSGETFCYTCPTGFGTSSPGTIQNSSCYGCPIGYGFSNEGDGCVPCAPGQYALPSSTTCSMCDPGFFSKDYGSSFCLPCDNGTFQALMGASSCSLCPEGTWGDQPGQTSSAVCNPCPQGTYGPSTGVSSSSECILCSAGKYSKSAGNKNISMCRTCPASGGIVCVDGTVNPVIQEGYWFDGDNLFQCVPFGACQGGLYGNSSTLCSVGYTGAICSDCESGYFRIVGSCRLCMNIVLRWVLIVVVCCVCAYVSWIFLHSARDVPQSVKVSLVWLQILSLYPSLFNQWPSQMKAIFDLSGIMNFEIGYFGFGCDIRQTFYSFMTVKLSAPACVWALFLLFEFMSHRRLALASQSMNVYGSHVLMLMNVFAVQLFSTMFQIFNCSSQPDGSWIILADPSERCYSSKWIAFVCVDAFFMLLYVVFIPAFVIRKLLRSPNPVEDPGIQVLLGRFMKPYRIGAEGFEIARLLFKLLFVIIRDTLSISGAKKSGLLLLLLISKALLENHYRPYPQQFKCDISLLWSQILIVLLGSQFIFSSSNVSSDDKSIVGGFLTALVFCFISYILIATAYQVHKRNKPTTIEITAVPS